MTGEPDELGGCCPLVDRRSKPEVPWMAGSGCFYYYITDEGAVESDIEQWKQKDRYRYLAGNYFKTRLEAERYKVTLLEKTNLGTKIHD